MPWNPQESMMTILAAAESGEPLTVTPDDLRARLDLIIQETLVARGWSEHDRGEARKIGEALSASNAK